MVASHEKPDRQCIISLKHLNMCYYNVTKHEEGIWNENTLIERYCYVTLWNRLSNKLV